jgi:SAM-dependent methyltransferase
MNEEKDTSTGGRPAGEVKEAVKDRYGGIARQAMFTNSCCAPSAGCGCGPSGATQASADLGYDPAELAALPQGADMGLGCGNPIALAGLEEGDVVVDLGSGAGIDCFLAARRVGRDGRVIGVDMTPEMIARAGMNAIQGGFGNVEFRLGELEDLPVEDGTADWVISNCVVNLVPDKAKAFSEAYRVLKPGGRLAVSDIVLTAPLPEEIRGSVEAYTGCIAGASMKDEYLAMMSGAGFGDIEVVGESDYGAMAAEWLGEDARAIGSGVKSIKVVASK